MFNYLKPVVFQARGSTDGSTCAHRPRRGVRGLALGAQASARLLEVLVALVRLQRHGDLDVERLLQVSHHAEALDRVIQLNHVYSRTLVGVPVHYVNVVVRGSYGADISGERGAFEAVSATSEGGGGRRGRRLM